MRKAVAAIRRRNTLSAVPLAIQKPAGQANNPAYRRLQRFFVLTKGMSLIGPRPERPAFCAEFEKRIHGWHYRTMVTPGLSGLAQVTGGYRALPGIGHGHRRAAPAAQGEQVESVQVARRSP